MGIPSIQSPAIISGRAANAPGRAPLISTKGGARFGLIGENDSDHDAKRRAYARHMASWAAIQ
jgi:hypothetical protein